MPVTFSPASHKADSYPSERLPFKGKATPLQLLEEANHHISVKELLQSSVSAPSGSNRIFGRTNGLIGTVCDAYNRHRALVLRPDDIWIGILSQFNFYVNANAESLRSLFVAHEGKKKLTVTASGTRYTIDFGDMARQMAGEIDKNVVDPELKNWALPDFSTTTDNDKTVASVVLMATLKNYFEYGFMALCGLPRVTLLGEKSDWENIVQRIEKLKEYGDEPARWYELLKPVCDRFVKSFDDPEGEENKDFWGKVVTWRSGGSGPTWLSGWITAFAVWDADGKWMGNPAGSKPAPYDGSIENPLGDPMFSKPKSSLSIDGAHYHVLDSSKVPTATVTVDVELNDNGEKFDTMMAAGVFGTEVSDSGDTKLSESGKLDTIQPVNGWWMFIKGPEKEQQMM